MTAAGKLTIYYNKTDGKPPWDQATHELFQFESSSIAITHAAICCVPGDKPPAGEVWIASIDASNQVHVRIVSIKWQQIQASSQQPQTQSPHLSHTTTISLGFVNPQLKGDGIIENTTPTQVSFLRLILDRTAPAGERGRVRLLIGCHTSPEPQGQGTASGRFRGTVISRYDLQLARPEVDACFTHLGSKQPSRNAAKPQLFARRLDEQSFEGTILDIREHRYGSMLSFAYSDGKIEYRDLDLQIPPLEFSNDSITSLPSIGFSFNDGEPCLYNIPSTHGCVRATMGVTRAPKLQPIQASVPLMEVTDPEFKTKASAVFALELLNSNITLEIIDIIVAMRAFSQQLSSESPSDEAEIFRIKVLQNYGGLGAELTQKLAESPEKLNAIQTLQRLLSLQESFGHHGESDERSAPSLVAWIILNLRHCFFQILLATAPIPGQPQNKARILQPGESNQNVSTV